jgi:hypothetical protein
MNIIPISVKKYADWQTQVHHFKYILQKVQKVYYAETSKR